MTLPFDLSPSAAMFLAIAILIAAYVRGYAGFGFSALVVSASSLVTNPLYFIAVTMFCELAMTLQQWSGIWRDVDWRRVAALMIGALVGVPFGLWVITQVPLDTARAVIAIYVMVMCLVMLRGWRITRPQGFAAHTGMGTFAGMTNAVSMAGLPVAAYFTAQGVNARIFRATLIVYFAILDVFTAPLMWWHGLVTWETLLAFAIALPIMVLGIWIGSRHFLKTDPQDFRKFAIGLLAVLAALGLLKSVI